MLSFRFVPPMEYSGFCEGNLLNCFEYAVEIRWKISHAYLGRKAQLKPEGLAEMDLVWSEANAKS